MAREFGSLGEVNIPKWLQRTAGAVSVVAALHASAGVLEAAGPSVPRGTNEPKACAQSVVWVNGEQVSTQCKAAQDHPGEPMQRGLPLPMEQKLKQAAEQGLIAQLASLSKR